MPISHLAYRPSAAAIVLCILTLPMAGLAHLPAPGHDCTAPTRPADDQNDVLWQRFLDDVDGFRACISNYSEANHQAAERHQQAANDATLDWNRFVRAELNVPEDYPWPPPEQAPHR
jgi:hypothetical protein